jgi:hypothetical protein
MTDIIKAMNPTAPLTTEEAALAAAKVSAVGMVIGGVNQAVEAWYVSTPQGAAATAAATAAMMEQMTGQTPDAAQLAQQSGGGLMVAGAFVVLALILAFVQWRKPNTVLPILFLVLVTFAFGSACLGLFMPALGGGQPLWLTLFSLVTMAIAAIMHIASIRGVSALNRIRMAAAQ